MSQEVVSQIVERTCEGCGKKVKFEMVNPTDNAVTEMTEWFTIVREVADSATGRFHKLMVQSCSMPCIVTAALKLAQVPSNTPDDIDLSALRQSTDEVTN